MTVAISAQESAVELANASSDIQVAFLKSLAVCTRGPGYGCWPMQCREIADEMSDQDKADVAVCLGTLLEHLK